MSVLEYRARSHGWLSAAGAVGTHRATKRPSDMGEGSPDTRKPYQPLAMVRLAPRRKRPDDFVPPPPCVDCGSAGDGPDERFGLKSCTRYEGRCEGCWEEYELVNRPGYVAFAEAEMAKVLAEFMSLPGHAPEDYRAPGPPRWDDRRPGEPLSGLIAAWDRRDKSLFGDLIGGTEDADEAESEAA